jgi:FdhE protein
MGWQEEVVEAEAVGARIDRVLQDGADLPAATRCRLELLRVSCQGSASIQPPILPRERARGKLADRVPLLHGEALDLGSASLRELFERGIRVFDRRSNGETAELTRALGSGRLDFERALGEAVACHQDHLAAVAGWAGVSARLLADLLEPVAGRALRSVAPALAPLLRGARWEAGYCPVCGAWPGLAEARPEQARDWRCLRCGSAWSAQPRACPFCGGQLRRAAVASRHQPRLGLEACERCRRYVKVLERAERNPVELLLLYDLVSAELDVAAVEQGLVRPEQPGFRLELAEEMIDEALEDLLEAD